jgi:hypothetical protein
VERGATPRAEYERSLAEREAEGLREAKLQNRLAWIRLTIFLGLAVLVWAVIARGAAWGWLLVPVALFVVALRVHERVIRARRRAERAAVYYRCGLARLDDRWTGVGPDGGEFEDPDHPYASDLDLFGEGSLFQLLNLARTRTGERTLAGWLKVAVRPEEIRRRQEAVDELRGRLDLREQVAVLGEEIGDRVHPDGLLGWSSASPVLTERWPVAIAGLLGVANLGTFVLWMQTSLETTAVTGSPLAGAGPFLASALASTGLVSIFRRRAEAVAHHADRPVRELTLLSRVLEVLERQRFQSPKLTELHARLVADGRASRQIGRLARLVAVDEWRRNMVFHLFASMFLVGTQLAFALERWRVAHGPQLDGWLRAVGELEALASLARYAYEHPTDPFPQLVDGGPLFQGASLGHPLLPQDKSIPNDVALSDVRLLMVSGSNMSGKSTLLRTVGVNAALAQAGAPVRAQSLTMSSLTIGACMRVQDSLQQGMSHFYAEIHRLRRLVRLADDGPPLLFLLDEILHGTNSHDRRLGAEAVIRSLFERGAIGLVTTHDLALAAIADDLAPRAANVHFVDHLDGDTIRFDYRLHPGVVRKSNALELMRAIGLEV